MIRTARDVKPSLEVARKQRAFCRTFSIEQKIREELQHEFGAILSDEEKGLIISRERKSLKARDDAIKRAQMHLLKQKERASLACSVKNGSHSAEKREENQNFAKVILGY